MCVDMVGLSCTVFVYYVMVLCDPLRVGCFVIRISSEWFDG